MMYMSVVLGLGFCLYVCSIYGTFCSVANAVFLPQVLLMQGCGEPAGIAV